MRARRTSFAATARTRCIATRPRHVREHAAARACSRRSAPPRVLSRTGAEEFQGNRSARASAEAGLHALPRSPPGEQKREKERTPSRSSRTGCAWAAPSARAFWSRSKRRCVGQGRINIHIVGEGEPPERLDCWRYSSELHCAGCDLSYREPVPSFFSFNSPLGACDSCRGLRPHDGHRLRTVSSRMRVSHLRAGAIRPRQTESNAECSEDLEKFAKKREIPLDRPWRELSAAQRQWVIEGERRMEKGCVVRPQALLRVARNQGLQDARARALVALPRLYAMRRRAGGASPGSPDALLWRIGGKELADSVLPPLAHAARRTSSGAMRV